MKDRLLLTRIQDLDNQIARLRKDITRLGWTREKLAKELSGPQIEKPTKQPVMKIEHQNDDKTIPWGWEYV